MDSLIELENQIKEAKLKRRKIILEAMDGRSQVHISEKTGIDNTKISRWANGDASLTDEELNKLSSYLGVEFY